MESSETPTPSSDPDDNISEEAASPPKKPRKAFYKWFDRALNVVLVLAALTWLADKLSSVPTDPKEIADIKTQRLEKAAERAFGLKEIPAEKSTPSDKANPMTTAPASPSSPSVFEANKNPKITETSALDVHNMLAAEKEKPVILFVYASWCNYCANMLPTIDKYYTTQSDKLTFIPISIDEYPDKLAYYFEHKANPLHIPALNVSQKDEVIKISRMLSKKGLQFTGSIPYMAVFYQQTPIVQATGFVEPDKLKDVLEGAVTIKEHLKTKDLPKEKTI